jgi:hypothetical protein
VTAQVNQPDAFGAQSFARRTLQILFFSLLLVKCKFVNADVLFTL